MTQLNNAEPGVFLSASQGNREGVIQKAGRKEHDAFHSVLNKVRSASEKDALNTTLKKKESSTAVKEQEGMAAAKGKAAIKKLHAVKKHENPDGEQVLLIPEEFYEMIVQVLGDAGFMADQTGDILITAGELEIILSQVMAAAQASSFNEWGDFQGKLSELVSRMDNAGGTITLSGIEESAETVPENKMLQIRIIFQPGAKAGEQDSSPDGKAAVNGSFPADEFTASGGGTGGASNDGPPDPFEGETEQSGEENSSQKSSVADRSENDKGRIQVTDNRNDISTRDAGRDIQGTGLAETSDNTSNVRTAAADTNTRMIDVDEVINQVADRARIVITEDKTEMLMDLKPDNLGRLTLKLVTESGIVTARFVTENRQVRQILESNMQMLKDALEEQGIMVDGLSVSVGHESEGGYEQHEDMMSAGRRTGIKAALAGSKSGGERVKVQNPYEVSESSIDLTA